MTTSRPGGDRGAGVTAAKEGDFSAWYTQVVTRAELADYAPVKGLIVLRPDGYAIWEAVRGALDARFAERGVRNGFLPVLIPESLLGREKEHFEGFNPEVFWVTRSGNDEIGDRLALRPTSEALAYTMYSKWIQSWRDLPLRMNFWNTALRAEIKGTKPFLRTSEFLWQEGHTAHATEQEARDEVAAMLGIYGSVVRDELAIPVIHGDKSEREKFVGAVYTSAIESVMPDGRALQMGTSHFLGTNFSGPFGIRYSDRENREHLAWQTSWGVSWRLIGAMIMVHGDDNGLVLPPRVAPVQAVVVPIVRGDAAAVAGAARAALAALRGAGVRAVIDEREGFSPGYKFNYWELRGVPLRIEVGPRDAAASKVTISRRYDRSRSELGAGELGRIPGMLEEIQRAMLARAEEAAGRLTHRAGSYGELAELAGRGLVYAAWCGGGKCEERVKEETGAEIRVVPPGGADGAACVVCGAGASSVPVFARGY
ncbi:MAG: proline--tRNA ligase [Nitrosopumilus sp.]|nr:proline--tRNA ligase [Nitrosopumilus sp.]CAI9831481.1 Proline--tRNA ligase [Nitrosopumilaceae archaeon]MDA7940765.1 proline--tRNA ligase [Nitrosopumilus sp.]MDA7942973.1 proline--tRNA ligase [Nitrosopumilus sp.]MDA7944616.1 proline--tRNA ligase [Nitrosopumilus sp.]